MSLGIVFDSILEPLRHQIPCFGVIVLVDDVLKSFSINFDQIAPKSLRRYPPFSVFVS